MKNDLTNNILKTIEKQQVQPTARWIFLLKNYIIWIVALLALIVGGVSFAVVLEIMQNSGLDLYTSMGDNNVVMFLMHTLPFVWLLLVGLFIVLAYFNVRNTKRGYKYALHIVIFGSVAISAAFGTVLFATGVGDTADTVLSEKIPTYKKVMNRNDAFWHRPDDGFLQAQILATSTHNALMVIDHQQKNWEVDTEEAKVVGHIQLAPGVFVRVIGRRIDDDEFQAFKIGPVVHPRTQRIRMRREVRFLPQGKHMHIKIERKIYKPRNTKQETHALPVKKN